MTVSVACEMPTNALRSLTQRCLTAYFIGHNISMIQAIYQALHISAGNANHGATHVAELLKMSPTFAQKCSAKTSMIVSQNEYRPDSCP